MLAHEHPRRAVRVVHRAAQLRVGTVMLTAGGIAWYVSHYFA